VRDDDPATVQTLEHKRLGRLRDQGEAPVLEEPATGGEIGRAESDFVDALDVHACSLIFDACPPICFINKTRFLI